MSQVTFSVKRRSHQQTTRNTSRSEFIWGPKPVVDLPRCSNVAGPVVFDPGLAGTTFVTSHPVSNGSPRNIFPRGGSYWNLDLSVVKRSTSRERVTAAVPHGGFQRVKSSYFDNPRDASSGSPALTSSVFAQTAAATVRPAEYRRLSFQTAKSGRVIQLGLKAGLSSVPRHTRPVHSWDYASRCPTLRPKHERATPEKPRRTRRNPYGGLSMFSQTDGGRQQGASYSRTWIKTTKAS